MKLLIVDDQVSVVRGLVKGIDWQGMGFDVVDTALNALDARVSLQRQRADVMLCDIEMPVENGLDLLKWMREQGMETRCIFLTAHAKFHYAQEAIHYGGFDYIVQPAPYTQIAHAVQKAVNDVQSSQMAQELQRWGEIFDKRQSGIAANLLRDHLGGTVRPEDLESFEELGLVPLRTQDAWLILIQPLRWEEECKLLEWNLLSYAVGNICGDVFPSEEVLSLVCAMPETHCLALALQSRTQEELDSETLASRLAYLQSACEHYLHFTSALYPGGPQPFRRAAGLWQILTARCGANVTLQSGIFWAEPQQAAGADPPFHNTQIASWQRLLQEGYASAAEQEALQLLDSLAAAGQLNRATLQCFYQDYMQMLFNALKQDRERLHAMFQEPEALELYRSGMKNVHTMRALIRHVTAALNSASAEEEHSVVEQVCRYIAQHLESELRREELAQVAHLSPDYLTRIFKRETGQTLKEYVVRQKLQEAQSLLRTTSLPISLIAAKVGYSNFSHFSNSYRKAYGRSPQEERQNDL